MPLSGCSTLRDAASGRGISGIRTTILGHGPDLRFGIYVHGSQSRSAHNERQRSFAARTLLPVGTPRPFLHPSSVTSTVPAAFISAAGYEYYVHDPLLDGGSVSMTPARALAEPWAYWSGLYAGDSNDINDWVTPQNLNLWGNASRSGSYSTSSSKSIYDPCPPGWRVPAPAAFEQASFSRTGTSRNNVYYLRSRTGTSVTYPMGGYFTGHAFRDNGTRVDVWTNAPAQLNGRCLSTSTAFTVSASAVDAAGHLQRDYALPVRCVAE